MLLDIPIINPPAFEDEYIEQKVHKIIEGMGVQVYRRCMVHELIEDENTNHIKQVIFKKLNVVEMDHEEEEEEEEMEDEDQNDEEMDEMGNEAEDVQKKKKKRRS